MMPYWKKACKTTSEEGVHLIPRHTLGSRGLLRLEYLEDHPVSWT